MRLDVKERERRWSAVSEEVKSTDHEQIEERPVFPIENDLELCLKVFELQLDDKGHLSGVEESVEQSISTPDDKTHDLQSMFSYS
jgi:hypothetical protein